MGKDVDYVLLLPLQDESQLMDIICADEDKEYKRITKEGFIIWMWNPEKKTALRQLLTKDDMIGHRGFARVPYSVT